MVATTRIQTSAVGTSTFQPTPMNWREPSRGGVPRGQMNTNSATTTLRKNQSSGPQPVLAWSQMEIGHGARQPPRNSVAASAETVTMLMYSARKNSANFSDEYSVWKPPTSSLSASGRSNGARLVSPTTAIA